MNQQPTEYQPVIHKWFPLVLAVLALGGIVLFQQYSRYAEAQQIAEQDARCEKKAAAPYVPFKSDLGCIGWKRIRSDIPLPAEA